MHLRRALLLFALVLGLTALATAIAPAPKRSDEPQVAPVAPVQPAAAPTVVKLDAPPAKAPRPHAVASDARVIVEVTVSAPGQVEVPKLGQIQAVTSDMTARFDLVDLAPGRYDVMFEPALEAPVPIGTLVSR